jgi:hypothetical protein
MWVAKRRHRLNDYEAWALICSRAPKIANELIGQAADWIVAGKEANGLGVGGLNQQEVNTLQTLLEAVSV